MSGAADVGHARERTVLAWQRSALAAATLAAIELRYAIHVGATVGLASATVALLLALSVLGVGIGRGRTLRSRGRRDGVAPASLTLATVMAALALLAVTSS